MATYGLYRKVHSKQYKCVVTTSDHTLAIKLRDTLPDIDLMTEVTNMVEESNGMYSWKDVKVDPISWSDTFDYP